MSNVRVKQCDTCKALDSADARVRRVMVVQPRFDLCATDRLNLLVAMGVSRERALDVVRAQDELPYELDGPDDAEQIAITLGSDADPDAADDQLTLDSADA